jgi:FkbM family methyltransferase
VGIIGSVFAAKIAGMPNDVFFKVGLITIIGLADDLHVGLRVHEQRHPLAIHLLRMLPFAVGEQRGKAFINLYPSLNTGSSNINSHKRRWEKQQAIKLVPLSDLLDSLHGVPVDLLKVDVEGFEHKVLVGAGRHLGTTIKQLVVELHPAQLATLGSSVENVVKLLRDRGYSAHSVAGIEVWKL